MYGVYRIYLDGFNDLFDGAPGKVGEQKNKNWNENIMTAQRFTFQIILKY